MKRYNLTLDDLEDSLEQMNKWVDTLTKNRESTHVIELIESSTEILKALLSETRSVDALQTHRLKLALDECGVKTDELDVK